MQLLRDRSKRNKSLV